MARNTYRGSYVPRAVSHPQAAEEKKSGGGGLLDFLPDIGAGTALREIGEGITGLIGMGKSLVTPGKDGMGFADVGTFLGKGITSSVVGTAETAIPGDFLSDVTAAALGQEWRPKDFGERAGERGILPALVEDIGNVSIVGGLATAPVKGAAIAARAAGSSSRAASLNAVHASMKAKPLIRAAQHPYIVSAQHLRSKTRAAKVVRDAELGLLGTGPAAGVSQKFNELHGPDLGLDPFRQVNPLTQADPKAGAAMAQAYADAPDFDSSPETQASFAAYAEDIETQFDFVQEQGKVRFEFVDEDPYSSHAELMDDVSKNGVMKVFRTKDGDHPYLSPEQNDKFRAVHDFIGHTELGNDFSRHGEEVAWALHSQMFRPEARRAMTIETRGQNSALNYSPENIARKARGEEAEFAPQKVALLPEEFSSRPDAFIPEGPTSTLTKGLAKAEDALQAVSVRRFARDMVRAAETSRRTAARSEAMKLSVVTAREHLLGKAAEKGLQMDRTRASAIVGEAVTQQITGVRALIDEALGRGVPESILQEAGLTTNKIPAELDTPELRQAIDGAVDAWIVEGDKTREILLAARKGDEGLADPLAQPDAMTPALTPKDRARLNRARKALDRAENKNAQILAQKERIGREITVKQDRVTRAANAIADIDQRVISQIEAFDSSRFPQVKAFANRASLQKAAHDIYEATLANDGASFDPHVGRFLELGAEDGYMVAVRDKTILEVPVDQFTPQHIEQVVDAFQELFAHPEVMVGTWVEDGNVHIDLSQRVDNVDDAMILGGARQQLAITDMRRGTFPSVPLRSRPDIAAAFIDKNAGLKKTSQDVRDALEAAGRPIEESYAMQDLLMRQAVRAAEIGRVAHPDDFFRQFTVQAAKRPSSKVDALRQIVKRWDPTDPKQQDALWAETQKIVKDLDKALLWYNRSHDGIEKLLRDRPDVTLLDGTPINPADLTYQLLAATSFNESPRGNLAITMKGLANVLGPESDIARSKVQGAVAQFAGGKMTLDDLLVAVTDGASTKGTGRKTSPRLASADTTPAGDPLSGAAVPLARQAAWAVLSGKTMSPNASTGWAGWTPEFMMDEFKSAWGIAKPPFDPDKAYAYIEKVHPDFIDRATKLVGEAGPDAVRNQAIREYYGSKVYTKVLSFWDNLAHPETSQAVTLDMWMARLFGKSGFETQKGWADVAEGVRQMADKAGVLPHQIQAALWVYVNKEVAIQRSGHFLARAEEARAMLRAGEVLDDLDPISTWADEAKAPYQPDAPGGFRDAELPVMRDGAVGTETISTRKSDPKKNLGKVDKQLTSWLKARDQINELVRQGDVEGAEKLLNKHITKTKRALSGAMGGDANAMDFADLLDMDNMTPASLRAYEELMDRLDGEGTTLAQRFEDDILGEFVPATDTTKAAIRLFKDGSLATLVHENGHMLRRMLTPAEMSAVERSYGVKGGKWDVPAEERFANDFMKYLSRTDAPAGLEGTFAAVRSALRDIFDMVMRTIHRGKVDPEVADIFDDWLNPTETAVATPDSGSIGLDLPAPETGTRPQIGARPSKAMAGTGEGLNYHSGRQGAKALAEVERLQKKRTLLEQTKARLEKDVVELEELLETGMTKAEIEQRKLIGAAGRMEEKVKASLANPSMSNTPTRWQPLMQAYRDLAAVSDQHPAIADILGDAKNVLPEIQRLAMERGFNPSHVSQFTPAMVRRLVFNNLQLGLGRAITEDKAGARNKRTGALQRMGVQEQSIEALLSASIDATIEARTGAVIDYVEKSLARKVPKDGVIPDGWVPWSPTRTFLLTGEEVSEATGRAVQTAPLETMVVPERAVKMLRAEVSDHDHWSYTSIGKMTSPWRAAVLTLSPGWYVRNFAGNLAMATADGVSIRLGDWKKAWQSYRNTDEFGPFADVPFVAADTLATEAGSLAKNSVIPGLAGPAGLPSRAGLSEAMSEGGKVRGATGYAMARMQRVNAVVDEFARTAVYHKNRRLNMTQEQAWKGASEAMVDYQNLSPFERKAVRSVIPFYSWQKGILKVTVKQAIDHPARAAILQQLGQMQEDYVGDLFGVEGEDVPDYYRHMVGEKNVRSWNPFADTSEILSPEGIARSLNPFAEIAVRKGLGAPEFFPESYRMGTFGTVEPDVNVPAELGRLATSSPAGRVAGGDGGGVLQMGLHDQDIAKLSERIKKSRERLAG